MSKVSLISILAPEPTETPQPPQSQGLAVGLDSPRKLSFDRMKRFYVAEAGRGETGAIPFSRVPSAVLACCSPAV